MAQKLQTYLTFLILLFPLLAIAQTGTLKGKVTDAETGEGLIGAKVYIDGTAFGSFTDIEGNYELTGIPPGTYTVSVQHFEKGTQHYEGVAITAGVNNKVLEMGKSVVEHEIIEFVVKKDQATEEAAIEEVKKAENTKNVISKEEFSRTGDNNAGEAAKRVSGVTLEGGRYVYIRGLSDRYSKTVLNGAEVPSLDPERNSVQMDLFPSIMIDQITVEKTFKPDLPGDFTGGLINIITKDFPDSLEVNLGLSTSYNTQASFKNDFLTYENGKTDFLGFDDGSRALPDNVRDALVNDNVPEGGVWFIPGAQGEAAAAQQTEYAKSFNKVMSTERMTSFTNHSFSGSIGNKLDSTNLKFLHGKTFGYSVAASYRRSYDFYDDMFIGRYELTGLTSSKDELTRQEEYDAQAASQSVTWGLIGNGSYRFNSKNKVSLILMRNQSGDLDAFESTGIKYKDNPDATRFTDVLQWKQRSMLSAQFRGEHDWKDSSKVKITWVGSYTKSRQYEPDYRVFISDSSHTNGDLNISASTYPAPTRFYRDMNEHNIYGQLNIEKGFNLVKDLESKIKVGGATSIAIREFEEIRVDFVDANGNDDYSGDIQQHFSDNNLGWINQPNTPVQMGLIIRDQTFAKNNYSGDRIINAGYAMSNLAFHEDLDLIVGARAEKTDFEVVSEDPAQGVGILDNLDILPSLNITYKLINAKEVALNDSTSITRDLYIRAGYSRTLARPTFREKAPYSNFDFRRNLIITGNPGLVRTVIDNIDVRFEFYPKAGEFISLGAFYKQFQNPIEVVTVPTAPDGSEITWGNNESATLYGVELEFRKNLGFISETIKNFKYSLNLTFVQSKVDINAGELAKIRATDPDHPETRDLYGQSPYIVNSSIIYEHDNLGLSSNITFNVFGPRLAVVTDGGTPDVFEQPRGSLDFTLKKEFGNLGLRFRANNLLNPETKLSYDFKGTEYIYSTYKKGRSFSLSLSYKF